MIDPKMLELSVYEGIPHLMTPVVTDPEKAALTLQWVTKEMEKRYKVMSKIGVRNIFNYNSYIEERVDTNTIDSQYSEQNNKDNDYDGKKMPYIVVIVDEMADLMLTAGKTVEASIQRLAQMARAAGIHIIMATQRPSVDVITGVIKANFPTRISFQVTSKIDSRTILGYQGAESLLGKGDMLYMPTGSKTYRVHGPFVDDKEVMKVVNYLKQNYPNTNPNYGKILQEIERSAKNDEDGEISGYDDDLYKQAVDIVKTEKRASISYIQRRLRIGYNKAANFIEQMEVDGIVSAPDATGKRIVIDGK
jgi:S-DNA-T family DNA segregation ATPase FtsK/SpoIIIE